MASSGQSSREPKKQVPSMISPNHGTHRDWVSLAVSGYQASGKVEGSCLFLTPNNLSWLPIQLKLAQHLIKTAGPYMHIDLPLSINFAHGLRSTPHTYPTHHDEIRCSFAVQGVVCLLAYLFCFLAIRSPVDPADSNSLQMKLKVTLNSGPS